MMGKDSNCLGWPFPSIKGSGSEICLVGGVRNAAHAKNGRGLKTLEDSLELLLRNSYK